MLTKEDVAPATTTLKQRIAAAAKVNVRRELVRIGSNVRQDVNVSELLPSIRELGITTALWLRPLPEYKILEPDMVENEWRIVNVTTNEIVSRHLQENLAHIDFNGSGYGDRYELIAGFRRMRCAQELELPEVPALVIDCTPEEAADLQLLENLDREQLTELDEAKAFRERVDSKRYGETVKASVRALAEQFHKSESHIYDRMALLKLSAPAREAFIMGEIDICLAKEISAVPGEKAQKHLLEAHAAQPFSVRTLRSRIEAAYMKPLEGAPFAEMDASGVLITTAGPCRDCPARTGNMVELFPHLKSRPNVCTDTGCYEMKVDAHREILLTEYRDNGHRVLTARESKPLFSGAYLAWERGWVLANVACPYDKGQRTWKQLARLVREKTIAACNGIGAVVELFEENPIIEKLVAKKIIKAPKSPSGRAQGGNGELALPTEPKRETEEERIEREIEHTVGIELARREALKFIARVEGIKSKEDEANFLRWLAVHLLLDGDYPLGEVLSRRGIAYDSDWRKVLGDMDLNTLRGVLFELHVANYYGLQGNDEPVNHSAMETAREFWTCVNLKALEKEVRADVKEQFRLPKDGEKITVPRELVDKARELNSCDLPGGKLRGVIEFRGRSWACHGSCSGAEGNIYAELILLVPREDRDPSEEPATDIGVIVEHKGVKWVQSKPEITIWPDKPPEQKPAKGKAKK
jgi:ParB/RepB/Spo0J family partition protein